VAVNRPQVASNPPQLKLNKKIQKGQETKKEPARRGPMVNMIDTANLGVFGLSDRERKRIKERLLQRQVLQWAD
jgi:hypothetical protein